MRDSRAITRSVRIPIDIDEKIDEHSTKKEFTYTEGVLDLVKIGLRVLNIKDEIDANPEMEKEINPVYFCLFVRSRLRAMLDRDAGMVKIPMGKRTRKELGKKRQATEANDPTCSRTGYTANGSDFRKSFENRIT